MNEIVGKSQEHSTQVNNIAVMRQMLDAMESHEKRIANLEDNMRINGIQEKRLGDAVNKVAVGYLGCKESNAYNTPTIRTKVYSAINREIKHKFDIPRRSELPAKDYERAMDLINHWLLDRTLENEIQAVNNQLNLIG